MSADLSTRYYVMNNHNVKSIVDSRTGECIHNSSLGLMPGEDGNDRQWRLRRQKSLCTALNRRDFRQNRQFGESRVAFAARKLPVFMTVKGVHHV